MDRVIDRLDKWMDYADKNDNRVTVECGLAVGLLNKARSGKSDVGKKAIEKILNKYQDINAVWLLTGEGNMLNSSKKIQTYDLKSDEKRTLRQVPIYNLEATAGFKAIYQDYSQAAEDYLSIPNLPPVDGAIYARGDSMAPLIASGDIVIFQKVQSTSNILWGHIYIVCYFLDGDEYTVLKYIRQSPKKNHIRLVSFNPSYDPQDIPIYSVVALGLVKASITFHTIG